MINKNLIPQDQVFWYLKQNKINQLSNQIKTNVLVIGGGMAGLSAAQSFSDKGLSVVVLEKNYCGAGASGKSSGFITPESEHNLTYFKQKFGLENAKKIWDFAIGGQNFIQENIKKYNIPCDYQMEDSFIVANSSRAFKQLQDEFDIRKQLNYSGWLYKKENVSKVLGSHSYYGALSYPDTFGINSYHYCQAMKEILQQQRVEIYEETPAININNNQVSTLFGSVQADYIIVCADRFLPNLINDLDKYVDYAQTFLMMSSSLKEEDIKKIFPEKNLLVWDTDLIYQYFRISNNRFFIGGSNFLSILWPNEQHNNYFMFKKLLNYTSKKFPKIKINFEYFWPGLIGISKDIIPIAGTLKDKKNIYYISAAAGLPWAAALGKYSAQKMIDGNTDMDQFFSIDRKFPINNLAQKVLGKKLSFALSNLVSLMK